jgi:septum formation protein
LEQQGKKRQEMTGKRASFILASASPRRRELLTQAGYVFEVIPSEVDESGFSTEGIGAAEYAKRLALAKAQNVAKRFAERLVVGADTVVDFGGQIIGKAKDDKEAHEIIGRIFSIPHQVITGVAIVRLCDGVEVVESDGTTVYPRKMTQQQLTKHLANGSWRDKAGAYAIQEIGDEFVERIEGSLTNVMGLPMELIEKLLERFL